VRYTQDKITIKDFYALQGAIASPPVGLGPNTGPTYWTQTIPVTPGSGSNFIPGTGAQSAPTPEFGQTNSNVSGEVGADWKPVDGVLAYVSISQNYRGAAFNGGAFISPAELTFARPETLRSYETGVKSEFWERRVILNGAVFYYDYRDLQFLDTFGLPNNQGFGQRITNAPKATIKGGELELRVKPVADIEARASLGLQDARFTSLTLHGINLDGKKIFQAPDVTASVAIDWAFAHISAGNLRFHVESSYYSKQYWDPRNVERVAQRGYAVENARLGFESLQKPGFAAGVWVKNLLNKRYATYELAELTPADGGFGIDQALAGEPRTYGVDVTYRF
jgi:iron complex outermembrane receptor protein